MKKIFLISLLAISLLLISSQVLAAGLVPCGGYEFDADGNLITQSLTTPVPSGWGKISDFEMAKLEPACQFCHFFVMFDNIIDFIFFQLVPPIAALMLVIGGVMFFFAGGNPQNVERGKKIMTSVVIGLVILYGAWLIINLFFSVVGVNTWTGLTDNPATPEIEGWWKIDCP